MVRVCWYPVVLAYSQTCPLSRKAAGDVGLKSQDHHTAKNSSPHNQHQFGKITAAEEGDHQESNEKK